MHMIKMCSHKVQLLIFCTTLSVIILCTNTGEKQPSITWQILNPPIVFGKDAELYCNASGVENCCTNTAVWMRGFNVIVHHSASSNSSKYISKQYSDGFSLIIKHFNEDDVNHQYTCLYEFLRYSEDLKLNASFMRYWPNKEELTINTTVSDNMIVADIMLDRVYPSPECIFVVNDEITATNVTIIEKSRSRLFYKMKINLASEINQMICNTSVAINCTVGGNDMVVMENTSLYCTDIITSSFDELTEKTKRLLITFGSILLVCIVAVTIVMIWRNKENIACTCKANLLNIEGGELQSTSSEMSCAIVCWGNLIYTSMNDSEVIPLLPQHLPCLLSDTRISVNSIPAQRLTHVEIVLNYAILNDKLYTQKMSSDARIDIARRSKQPDENFNIFIYPMSTKTQQFAERSRLICRVTLEFNALVLALNNKKRLKDILCDRNKVTNGNNINIGNAKPSLCSFVNRSSNEVKRFNGFISPPTQKMKDVAKIVMYACLHDSHYIQVLATNIGINLARSRSSISELYYFTYFPPFTSTTKTSESWIIGPAQKEKDVIKMVHYFVLHDALFYQKLLTNTRIKYAREQKSIISKSVLPHSSVPGFLNESTVNMADVIKASSFLPNWGIKKRCRMVSLPNLDIIKID